jgi:hypothetical protein
MAAFLDWFNGDTPVDPVLKAALAHLWFVTLHPFDDGNGRIARAADMALQHVGVAYYDILENTQKGDLERRLRQGGTFWPTVLRKARPSGGSRRLRKPYARWFSVIAVAVLAIGRALGAGGP